MYSWLVKPSILLRIRMNNEAYKTKASFLSQYLFLPYVLAWCNSQGNGSKPSSLPLWSPQRCKVSIYLLPTIHQEAIVFWKCCHCFLLLLSWHCTYINMFNPFSWLISLKFTQGHFIADSLSFGLESVLRIIGDDQISSSRKLGDEEVRQRGKS